MHIQGQSRKGQAEEEAGVAISRMLELVILAVEQLWIMARSGYNPKSGQQRWREVEDIRNGEIGTPSPDYHMCQFWILKSLQTLAGFGVEKITGKKTKSE